MLSAQPPQEDGRSDPEGNRVALTVVLGHAKTVLHRGGKSSMLLGCCGFSELKPASLR